MLLGTQKLLNLIINRNNNIESQTQAKEKKSAIKISRSGRMQNRLYRSIK